MSRTADGADIRERFRVPVWTLPDLAAPPSYRVGASRRVVFGQVGREGLLSPSWSGEEATRFDVPVSPRVVDGLADLPVHRVGNPAG